MIWCASDRSGQRRIWGGCGLGIIPVHLLWYSAYSQAFLHFFLQFYLFCLASSLAACQCGTCTRGSHFGGLIRNWAFFFPLHNVPLLLKPGFDPPPSHANVCRPSILGPASSPVLRPRELVHFFCICVFFGLYTFFKKQKTQPCRSTPGDVGFPKEKRPNHHCESFFKPWSGGSPSHCSWHFKIPGIRTMCSRFSAVCRVHPLESSAYDLSRTFPWA